MALGVWCELVCDNCSKTTSGEWAFGDIRREQMQADAEQEGWVRDGEDMYCSNSCHAAHKETERA